MSPEQQIDMTVALAENGFLVSWNEPVLVAAPSDVVGAVVSAVAAGLHIGQAAAATEPDAEDDGAEDESPEPRKDEQDRAKPADPNQVVSAVLGAVGEIDKHKRQNYRIVRRTLICSKPADVLPVLERAEAGFKAIMVLRLSGGIAEDCVG